MLYYLTRIVLAYMHLTIVGLLLLQYFEQMSEWVSEWTIISKPWRLAWVQKNDKSAVVD